MNQAVVATLLCAIASLSSSNTVSLKWQQWFWLDRPDYLNHTHNTTARITRLDLKIS